MKAKLFFETPTGTIKSWIRYFKISKSKCSPTEHSYFKSIIPDIAVGAFKLICEEDVLTLLRYCRSRETSLQSPKKRKKILSEEAEPLGGTEKLAEAKRSSLQKVQELRKSSSECRDLHSVSAVHKETSTPTSTNIRDSALDSLENSSTDAYKIANNTETITSICTYSSSSNEMSSSDDSDHGQTNTSSRRNFKFHYRSSRKLNLAEIDQETSKEIEDFKSFYSRPLNTQRNGHSLQPVTIEKIVERVLIFLKYLKTVKGIAFPKLKYIENGYLVEEFCSYLLSNDRKLKSLTISRYISAFINVFRYLHREESAFNQENFPSLSKLRALQSQLEFDARREKKCSSGKQKSIHYEEILQVAKKLLHEFEDAVNAIGKARALMDFCTLLLYTHMSGRCKEFVSLRIINSEHLAHSLEGNFLVDQPESSLTLLCKEYKTSRVYGSDKTVLEEPQLQYYIRLYLDGYRTKLLQGNSHDYFLVNHHGNPFTVPCFNKYIGNIFEKHCNFRLGINDIRSSLVTFFLTLPESQDNQMAESMATVMKHSVRSQRRFYDQRSTEVKKAPALRFLAHTATSAIFEDNAIIANESDTKVDDEGYSNINPISGDFVALVANNSTNSSPQIFIGRIIRYSKDRKDVLLAHMEEVSENLFKLVIGKSYFESTDSLIFPIDIVYKASDRVYELRSDKSDLHNEV